MNAKDSIADPKPQTNAALMVRRAVALPSGVAQSQVFPLNAPRTQKSGVRKGVAGSVSALALTGNGDPYEMRQTRHPSGGL